MNYWELVFKLLNQNRICPAYCEQLDLLMERHLSLKHLTVYQILNVVRFFLWKNYEISDEVIKFLASEIQPSIREMVGALNRILAFTKISTKSPTIYECQKILKDFINQNNKQINVESIQNVVAVYFNLSMNEMLSVRNSFMPFFLPKVHSN